MPRRSRAAACGSKARMEAEYPCVWRWKIRRPDRKGQRCRVLARGRLNSCLVEFPDGEKIVTSRYAVRRAAAAAPGR